MGNVGPERLERGVYEDSIHISQSPRPEVVNVKATPEIVVAIESLHKIIDIDAAERVNF